MTRPVARDIMMIAIGAALVWRVPNAAMVVGAGTIFWGLVGLTCLWLDGR